MEKRLSLRVLDVVTNEIPEVVHVEALKHSPECKCTICLSFFEMLDKCAEILKHEDQSGKLCSLQR